MTRFALAALVAAVVTSSPDAFAGEKRQGGIKAKLARFRARAGQFWNAPVDPDHPIREGLRYGVITTLHMPIFLRPQFRADLKNPVRRAIIFGMFGLPERALVPVAEPTIVEGRARRW